MSNIHVSALLDFVLTVVNITIKLVLSALYIAYIFVKELFHYIINVNMTENASKTSKRLKRKAQAGSVDRAVTNRSCIGANWQKLLSSNLIMSSKDEQPKPVETADRFTGTFRRARKKQVKSDKAKVMQDDMKQLNIGKETLTEKTDSNLNTESSNKKPSERKLNQLTKFIAMDCEMVGIGLDGNDHMLARVSLVNKFGDCLYDKFVKAREEVTDYRTKVSGIRKEDVLNGEEFATVQKEVSEIIKGRILVGHSLSNDLSVLFLSHPKRNIRDTARFKPFRKITKGSTPSLKRLAKEILGIDIQHGEHSSVEDARAAMQIYCTVAKKWEATLSEKSGHSRN